MVFRLNHFEYTGKMKFIRINNKNKNKTLLHKIEKKIKISKRNESKRKIKNKRENRTQLQIVSL